MARTALSASRSIDIMDFLGSFPENAFTMSEIARAIDINVASCHAILNELTERGYLSRHSVHKTYTLGPALIAMGNAAMRSQPIIAQARSTAEVLAKELCVPVSLTRVIGDEVFGVFAIPAPDGSGGGTRPGFRLPLAPPLGAPFLAWSNQDDIEAWIERGSGNSSTSAVAQWRKGLQFVRDRGYQVLLRSPATGYFPELIAELASGHKLANFKGRIAEHLRSVERSFLQPDTIEREETYDILLIAAPLFDPQGGVAYNLCIGDLSEPIAGKTVEKYAASLLRSCVQIMRANGIVNVNSPLGAI